MTISVMFDSNVYRKVLVSSNADFLAINTAIKTGKINAFLSEVIFQVESIIKVDRKEFFSNKNYFTSKTEALDEKGNIIISINMSPNYTNFPQGSNKTRDYLIKADLLNIKIIRNSRIAFPESVVPENMFFKTNDEKEFHRKMNMTGKVCNEIEKMGCGLAHIKKLAKKGTPICEILENVVRNKDENTVAKAFSEWADGDAIASCIGYEIEFFCTEDIGNKAGKNSVCSPANKKLLENKYPIKFVTIQQLLKLL